MDEQFSKDDIDWLDLPFADEGLMSAGMMIDIIREYGLGDQISREDALLIFDAADIWREALDHVLRNAAKRQDKAVSTAQAHEEIEMLEELWKLN